MDNHDDKLLKQFFAEASHQTIADDGFSRRVMHRLPQRINWFAKVWMACCIVVAAALAYFTGAIESLRIECEVLMRIVTIDDVVNMLPTMAMVVVVLLAVSLYEVFLSIRTD